MGRVSIIESYKRRVHTMSVKKKSSNWQPIAWVKWKLGPLAEDTKLRINISAQSTNTELRERGKGYYWLTRLKIIDLDPNSPYRKGVVWDSRQLEDKQFFGTNNGRERHHDSISLSHDMFLPGLVGQPRFEFWTVAASEAAQAGDRLHLDKARIQVVIEHDAVRYLT